MQFVQRDDEPGGMAFTAFDLDHVTRLKARNVKSSDDTVLELFFSDGSREKLTGHSADAALGLMRSRATGNANGEFYRL
jgi:hypothetical protein